MIKPYNVDEEQERDPYKGFSDSTAVDGNAPPELAPQAKDASAPDGPQAPEPYRPPKTATSGEKGDKPDSVSAPRTFAQMEAEGQARPPMPTAGGGASGAVMDMMVPAAAAGTALGGGPIEYASSSTGASNVPSPTQRQEPTADNPTGENRSENGFLGMRQQGRVRLYDDGHGGYVDQYANPVDEQGNPAEPTTTEPPPTSPMPTDPRASDAILDMLTGRATGATRSELETTTEAKALEQLNGSSPYDSNAVRDEYNWLAGNIDDDFATQNRELDNAMARKGLYGSSGKDFHSGRASDLNAGRRSAKTALARDLANKYATTKGQYDANAINQAQSVSGQGTNTQRAWLQDLFGYGDDAFNHDLASAEFGQRQNESEQDFLLRMLAMGYGV